jgi:hypothetical protein
VTGWHASIHTTVLYSPISNVAPRFVDTRCLRAQDVMKGRRTEIEFLNGLVRSCTHDCMPGMSAFLGTLRSTNGLRVRVEIMGSQNCGIVGESQPVLMMIDPTISTRPRRWPPRGGQRACRPPSATAWRACSARRTQVPLFSGFYDRKRRVSSVYPQCHIHALVAHLRCALRRGGCVWRCKQRPQPSHKACMPCACRD